MPLFRCKAIVLIIKKPLRQLYRMLLWYVLTCRSPEANSGTHDQSCRAGWKSASLRKIVELLSTIRNQHSILKVPPDDFLAFSPPKPCLENTMRQLAAPRHGSAAIEAATRHSPTLAGIGRNEGRRSGNAVAISGKSCTREWKSGDFAIIGHKAAPCKICHHDFQLWRSKSY